MEYMKFESLTSSSIEEWAKKFEALKPRSLTVEQAGELVSAALNPSLDTNEEFIKHLKEDSFLTALLYKRLEALHTYQLAPRVVYMLSYFSTSPGNVVMWLNYLQYEAFKRKLQTIDFDTFCMHIVPMGIPSQEDMQKVWDAQKVERPKGHSMGSDNLLDYPQFMESIRNIKKN